MLAQPHHHNQSPLHDTVTTTHHAPHKPHSTHRTSLTGATVTPQPFTFTCMNIRVRAGSESMLIRVGIIISSAWYLPLPPLVTSQGSQGASMHFFLQMYSELYGETYSRPGFDTFIVPSAGLKVLYNLQVRVA